MYSRENPSEEYKELVGEYTNLHENGNEKIPAHKMFNGISLIYYIPDLMDVILNKEKAKSILDYGLILYINFRGALYSALYHPLNYFII